MAKLLLLSFVLVTVESAFLNSKGRVTAALSGLDSLNLERWMAIIPDSTPFVDITIPATHDSEAH